MEFYNEKQRFSLRKIKKYKNVASVGLGVAFAIAGGAALDGDIASANEPSQSTKQTSSAEEDSKRISGDWLLLGGLESKKIELSKGLESSLKTEATKENPWGGKAAAGKIVDYSRGGSDIRTVNFWIENGSLPELKSNKLGTVVYTLSSEDFTKKDFTPAQFKSELTKFAKNVNAKIVLQTSGDVRAERDGYNQVVRDVAKSLGSKAILVEQKDSKDSKQKLAKLTSIAVPKVSTTKTTGGTTTNAASQERAKKISTYTTEVSKVKDNISKKNLTTLESDLKRLETLKTEVAKVSTGDKSTAVSDAVKKFDTEYSKSKTEVSLAISKLKTPVTTGSGQVVAKFKTDKERVEYINKGVVREIKHITKTLKANPTDAEVEKARKEVADRIAYNAKAKTDYENKISKIKKSNEEIKARWEKVYAEYNKFKAQYQEGIKKYHEAEKKYKEDMKLFSQGKLKTAPKAPLYPALPPVPSPPSYAPIPAPPQLESISYNVGNEAFKLTENTKTTGSTGNSTGTTTTQVAKFKTDKERVEYINKGVEILDKHIVKTLKANPTDAEVEKARQEIAKTIESNKKKLDDYKIDKAKYEESLEKRMKKKAKYKEDYKKFQENMKLFNEGKLKVKPIPPAPLPIPALKPAPIPPVLTSISYNVGTEKYKEKEVDALLKKLDEQESWKKTLEQRKDVQKKTLTKFIEKYKDASAFKNSPNVAVIAGSISVSSDEGLHKFYNQEVDRVSKIAEKNGVLLHNAGYGKLIAVNVKTASLDVESALRALNYHKNGKDAYNKYNVSPEFEQKIKSLKVSSTLPTQPTKPTVTQPTTTVKKTVQEEFFLQYAQIAKKIADESGTYASVMLAQAALESNYGKAPSGKNNFFGIKAFDNNYTEVGPFVAGGEKYKFQNFKSVKDGFESYAKLIWGEGASADFSGGLKSKADTPEKAIKNIVKAGFATDPTYVAKIMEIIKKYNLTQYDTKSTQPTKPTDYKKTLTSTLTQYTAQNKVATKPVEPSTQTANKKG